MPPDIIRAADLTETPWVNGAGRKADIASGAGWLVGFAWLDRDAPFSDYAGHDRTITLLHGNGFRLSLPEGASVTVQDPFVPAAFDGAGPIACHLLAGPCQVLNAITAYPGFSHTVQVLDAGDLAVIAPGPMVFVVVLRGTLTAGPNQAAIGDTLRLTAPMPLRASLDARVAVVRIARQGDDVA